MAAPTANDLAAELNQAADALLALVRQIDSARWEHVRTPGEWSVGKDVEHVADGVVLHQWVLRTSLGHKVGARPRIERERLTARTSRDEVLTLLQGRTDEALAFVRGLTAEQLDSPPRPPRNHADTIGELIQTLMIGHYGVHQASIQAKLS